MKIKNSILFLMLVSAILLIISTGAVILRNENVEWKKYQNRYRDLALEKTNDEKIKKVIKNKKIGISQIIVRDFGDERVDRCTTCHIAIDDNRFKNESNPLKSHPEIINSHPYRKFGCTVCHDGNGRGLTTYDAHGEDHYWIRTLLKGSMVESSCAKCHQYPYLKETQKLKAGAELFFSKACYACHKIEGLSNGKLGIELTEAGSKWDLHYLKESIEDPKANNPESMMPELKLTEDEVEKLLIFMRSLTGENLVEGPVQTHNKLKSWKNLKRPEVEISIESGKKIFNSFGCIGCHKVDGKGMLVGPELSSVGLQRTKEWIIQHFIDPRSLIAGSLMPDFVFSKSELESITLYMLSLKGNKEQSDISTDNTENNN